MVKEWLTLTTTNRQLTISKNRFCLLVTFQNGGVALDTSTQLSGARWRRKLRVHGQIVPGQSDFVGDSVGLGDRGITEDNFSIICVLT